MTAAPHSPQVERIARAYYESLRNPDKVKCWDRAAENTRYRHRRAAQAAIAAFHAEEMLGVLRTALRWMEAAELQIEGEWGSADRLSCWKRKAN